MRYLAPTAVLSITLAAASASADGGGWVDLQVEIEGVRTPLYDAPDGSGRQYVEAREGARYALHLRNLSGERLGVLLTVDGLNVISGEKAARRPGRMYILDPWETTTVQGWRTSLDEVRRFTFVDEKVSYAARVGKANAKMGWIEMAVHRERRPMVLRRRIAPPADEAEAKTKAEPPAAAAPMPRSADAESATAGGRSYPGTGWGDRTEDRVVVVDFEPEAGPSQATTIRYEYAPALEALGILVPPRVSGRLRQRDRGEEGFAPAPRW